MSILSVCLSANYARFFVHVASVRGSVLLQHVDDRPHRLSAGRGDGNAQRGRSVIYDCLVIISSNISIYLFLCDLFGVKAFA